MPALVELLSPDQLLDLKGRDKRAVLGELVAAIANLPGQPGKKILMRGILDREELRPTGIGLGIAIPHCKDQRIESFGIAFGRTPVPIDFGSPDGQPVRLLALIGAPTDRQTTYLRLLSTVTRFLKKERETLLGAEELGAVYEKLREY